MTWTESYSWSLLYCRLTNVSLGRVPRKMVKFNPGLSQILSKVFLSKNTWLELTKYRCAFTSQKRNENTKCYSKQCIGRLKLQKVNQNFNLWLALIGLSGTGWDLLGARCRFFFSPFRFCSSMQINFLSWKGLHPAKSLYVINLVNSDVTIKLVKLFIWFGYFYIRPEPVK